MQRTRLTRATVTAIVTAGMLLGFIGPLAALCGDCGTIYGAPYCLAFPPNFASCRTWTEFQLICVPGEDIFSPPVCRPYTIERCEAWAECAY